MIYDSGRILLTQYILVTIYICYNVWFLKPNMSRCHIFFFRIQVFMILIINCFYTMSGIFILLPIFLLKHDIDFL